MTLKENNTKIDTWTTIGKHLSWFEIIIKYIMTSIFFGITNENRKEKKLNVCRYYFKEHIIQDSSSFYKSIKGFFS